MMQVLILCGGQGTRAYPYTEYLPKPMLPINGQPILMHVMRIFAEQGHKEFILSLGYRKEVIIDYFEHKNLHDWKVELVDTGGQTDTGGRIYNCKHLLKETFMATYVDGLSDVRLDNIIRFHKSHKGLATITSVPLRSQYGTMDLDGSGKIVGFKEKPILREHWINAGFFVFDHKVFSHWEGDNLERDVFPNLLKKDLLYAYQHDGFFKSMDTYKDQQEIEEMYKNGNILWKNQKVNL
jgi:glucose-1-phosphate cytidylyltransferase